MAEEITTNAGVVTTNYVPNPTGVVNQGQLKQFTVRAVDELNGALPGGAGTNLNTMASNWAQDYLTNGWSATNLKPLDYTAMTVGQLKTVANMVYGRISAAGYTNLAPSWLPQNTNSDGNVAVLGQLKEVFDFDFSLSGATGLTATPGSGAVTLNWSPSTNVAPWVVEEQNPDGSWTFVSTLTNSASSYTVTGLTGGQAYNFQVFASGTNNVSAVATASATPLSVPQSGLVVWLKADTGLSQSGGVVTAWNDQSSSFPEQQTTER